MYVYVFCSGKRLSDREGPNFLSTIEAKQMTGAVANILQKNDHFQKRLSLQTSCLTTTSPPFPPPPSPPPPPSSSPPISSVLLSRVDVTDYFVWVRVD